MMYGPARPRPPLTALRMISGGSTGAGAPPETPAGPDPARSPGAGSAPAPAERDPVRLLPEPGFYRIGSCQKKTGNRPRISLPDRRTPGFGGGGEVGEGGRGM